MLVYQDQASCHLKTETHIRKMTTLENMSFQEVLTKVIGSYLHICRNVIVMVSEFSWKIVIAKVVVCFITGAL